MKTFTNLAHRAFKKCASLGTINKKRYYLFIITMLLTLGVGNAWAETGSATITFSTAGLTNGQSVDKMSFALGDYFTVTYTKNSAGTPPTYYNSGNAIRCYATKNTTNGNIITIAQTAKGSEVNAYITKVTYSGTHNKKGKTGFTYSGSPTSSDATNANYAAADKVTTATATLKETGGSANGQFYSTGITIEYVYEVSGPPATTYSVTIDSNIEHGTVTADVAEAAEDAIVTLTATPATGYKFGAWDVKDASSNAVTVTDNKFTMPASNVIVSASFVTKTQYTIKWNVVEGSVVDTYVYEGDALGTLPTADNCSSGKVFVGWTEATSVSADGSSITYAKETDVPTVDKEYNAVYATLSGSADKVDNLDLSLTGASGSTYSSWSGKKSVSDAVYAGNSAGGNSAIQLRKSSDSQAKSGIITTTSGGKAKKVVVTWNSNTASGRTLNVYGSNSAYSSVDNLYTDATAGTLIGTIVNGTSTELDITGDYEYIGMRSNGSSMYLDEIEITWSSTSYIDYSLDCEAHQDPFLTVDEDPINFGTVAQNATVTETLNVSGGYLAEDVALTISGTDASFFSVNPTTITKEDEIDQDITISYIPTAIGEHTAILTIKSGEIIKTVTLSGTVLAPGKWALVKNVAELSAGDEIIIASASSNYAIGIAASNNYKGAAITKVGETANTTAEVTILTVEETGVAEAPYALKDGAKYLYAAGPSNNYLRAQATNNANGQWAVTITEGVASIVAAKSSNRNVMQFNPNNGSPIFACYSSASYEALAIYRNSENVVKPVISGDADFVGSTQVTITAQSGLTVYYTTNGSTPDKTATQYSAPFTINATTTVKAIAYDASSNASGVAEMTFTKQELVNVATAMALEKDEVAYFDEFEVVKVVTGKGNIYIKDASGHGLIYDNTLAGQLKDGDRVQGFVGISSPYNGLPEAKPVDGLTVADLTITSDVAAEPYDFTSTAIASTDINKYVVFNDVEIATAVSMSNSNKEFSLTINGSNVAFYNQFSIEKTLEAGKTYDIYGFVSIYNEKLQVYFYQALEEDEVVTKYTVTYNAGGATGEVPVDNNEYTEGSQVTLESATGLTYEGYEYKGWKVTDANGTEIPVASNKFNMPASNVTVTAQWEEIVVAPRQDFSEGYWVLVTDASELAADDYIIVAAADYNVAMKSYESGNNCKQVEVTKVNNLLTWNENVGVFQLDKSGENYTFQDVNTEQYLYAAGGTSNNQLKAADEIPADENAKKYTWTISIEDGKATVKAQVEDNGENKARNTIMYNATEGINGQLFSCYASGQKDIALYKYQTTYAYTRNVPVGYYATMCLPTATSNYTGAEIYEVAWMEFKDDKAVGLYLDQVAAGTTLVAGKPYIFKATAATQEFYYEGEAVSTPVDGANGLRGTLTGINDGSLEGNYIIAENKFWVATESNYLDANRAYIDASAVETDEPALIPGRRRVSLGAAGENAETGIDNIITTDTPVKVIENGQLIIIRNGEKFNVQGVRL